MSCGLPAVVAKNGGPGESMREGKRKFGVLVDPKNPTDIAQGLLEVVADEGARSRYREAGIQRVVSRYTWERTAAGYLAVLEAIVSALYLLPSYDKNLVLGHFYRAVARSAAGM